MTDGGELITLPESLRALTDELFATKPEDVPGPSLTVVEALGCSVVASVTSYATSRCTDSLSLHAAWIEPDGALGVCLHRNPTCSSDCYSFMVTDEAVILDDEPAMVASHAAAESPDCHIDDGEGVARAIAHLEQLRRSHPSTDLLSLYGIHFNHWIAGLNGHAFPGPLQAAVEQVSTARGT